MIHNIGVTILFYPLAMPINDIFPPIDIALEMEPEELAPFILKDLAARGENISRYNYTMGTDPELVAYAGQHHQVFLRQLMEAWIWLEHEMFIAPKPGGGTDWSFITRRGRKVLEGEDFESFGKAGLLPSHDLDPVLVRDVKPLFIRGDYDTAVFQAFKEVEVRVRAKSGFPNSKIGQHLMRDALDPSKGPLTDYSSEASERQGASDLFAGAIALFKNPNSHRNVNLDDINEVVDLIHFANHLLRLIERSPQASTNEQKA